MRRYELVYIAFHDLPTEEFDSQLERYLSIISDYKGTIIKVDKWGKRRLAYPIQKRREGNYVLIDFVGDRAIVPEMERRLRIDDKILRFISVKTSDKVDMEEIEREISALREAEARKEAPPAPEVAEPVQEAGEDVPSDQPAEKPSEEPHEEEVEVKES